MRRGYANKRRDFDDMTSKPVRGIVTPAVSPDGSRIAFVALGDLWLLENGMLTRLTDDRYAELQPAFSRDGSMLVYASDREGSMDLWIRDMDSGDERRLTDDADTETMPVFSPDGTRVGYHDASGRLQLVEVGSGDVREFHEAIFRPGRISWSPDGSIIALSVLERYSTRYREGRNEVLLVSDIGSPERQVTPFRHRSIGTRGTDGPVWSPDGQSMAFTSDGALWVAPVNRIGEPIGPPRRYLDEIAESISWTGDSRSIVYVSPHGLKRVDAHDGSVEAIPLDLEWARHLPIGRLVVHAGKLFDGVNETVRRNLDVIIDGHRIRAIAPHAEESHAVVARVIDASAETVIPGLIEMHTHQRAHAGEALGRIWLAYGITSVREPSANPVRGPRAARVDRVGKTAGTARVLHRRDVRWSADVLRGRADDGRRLAGGGRARARARIRLRFHQDLRGVFPTRCKSASLPLPTQWGFRSRRTSSTPRSLTVATALSTIVGRAGAATRPKFHEP